MLCDITHEVGVIALVDSVSNSNRMNFLGNIRNRNEESCIRYNEMVRIEYSISTTHNHRIEDYHQCYEKSK